jgi:RimJ/RimL family protein N-acetyltransferase
MILPVCEGVELTDFEPRDVNDLVRHLTTRAVYRWTLRVPHPYNESHARQWLAIVADLRRQHSQPLQFAIRGQDGSLIGGIGLEVGEGASAHRAELGYWVGESHWNRGIATAAVAALTRYTRDQLKLSKLTAGVFAGNIASCRILVKNGFAREGFFPRHYIKDGSFIDAIAFGKLL